MSGQEPTRDGTADAALRTFEYDKIKTLYDYTKFHIGLYLTLGTLLVAAIGIKGHPLNFQHGLMWLAVLAIGLAGAAGGIVASTLPYCSSLSAFETMQIGPGGRQWLPGKSWISVEHRCFWVGIVLGALSVLLA